MLNTRIWSQIMARPVNYLLDAIIAPIVVAAGAPRADTGSKLMNRRDFLSKLSRTTAAAGAATAAAAIGIHARSRATVADGTEHMRAQVKALEARIDDLDASQRRLLRILAITFTVSTGFDVATLV